MARTLAELNQKRGELGTQIQTRGKEFQANGQKFKDAAEKAGWDQINKDYDAVMSELGELQESAAVTSRLAQIDEHAKAPINPLGIGLDDAGNGRVGNRPAPGNDGAELDANVARELAVNAWLRSQMGVALSKREKQAVRQLNFPIRAGQLRLALPQHDALNHLRNAWLDHRDANRGRKPFEYAASLTSTIGSSGKNVIPPETLLTASRSTC